MSLALFLKKNLMFSMFSLNLLWNILLNTWFPFSFSLSSYFCLFFFLFDTLDSCLNKSYINQVTNWKKGIRFWAAPFLEAHKKSTKMVKHICANPNLIELYSTRIFLFHWNFRLHLFSQSRASFCHFWQWYCWPSTWTTTRWTVSHWLLLELINRWWWRRQTAQWPVQWPCRPVMADQVWACLMVMVKSK